jgi:hypothetical protein
MTNFDLYKNVVIYFFKNDFFIRFTVPFGNSGNIKHRVLYVT